jgi:hypothetical protein
MHTQYMKHRQLKWVLICEAHHSQKLFTRNGANMGNIFFNKMIEYLIKYYILYFLKLEKPWKWT